MYKLEKAAQSARTKKVTMQVTCEPRSEIVIVAEVFPRTRPKDPPPWELDTFYPCNSIL